LLVTPEKVKLMVSYTDEVIAILRAYGMTDDEIKTSEAQATQAIERHLVQEAGKSEQTSGI
jgi:hypothetical protein